MESTKISSHVRELLGEDVCDILREDCEAVLHRVVYDAAQATGRIEPFGVADRRTLSAEDCLELRQSLLDDSTWRWDLITRHRAIPEALFEIMHGDRRAVFALDRRGRKLGVLRDLQIQACDLDANSRGAQILSRLVDAPGSGSKREKT